MRPVAASSSVNLRGDREGRGRLSSHLCGMAQHSRGHVVKSRRAGIQHAHIARCTSASSSSLILKLFHCSFARAIS
eukprot:7148807-Prymnesium_polylepis.2